jgi:hypothetical protein
MRWRGVFYIEMKCVVGWCCGLLVLTSGSMFAAVATKSNPEGQAPDPQKQAVSSAEELKKAGPLPAEVRNFAKVKRRQAEKLADAAHEDIPPEAFKIFDATAADDFRTAFAMYTKLARKVGAYQGPRPAYWQPLIETEMAAEHFSEGELKYTMEFGKGIIDSIPKGSIYFGGTDSGRGVVTALCRSHENGDPIFVLTQNALVDGTYMTYLRQMYGSRLNLPMQANIECAFSDYLADATRRYEHDKKSPRGLRQMKPGEDIQEKDGRINITGQVAVMSVNALIAKTIFDNNPDRQFYIEESFPLDWMYPYLTPNDLILKINRQKLDTIPPEILAKDETLWTARVDRMIGPWLTAGTSVKDICGFARKVHLNNDLSGFGGDAKFVKNDYSIKSFSKLRTAIGGVYQWRAQHSHTVSEHDRMQNAAEFAFKQAYALCPMSPEALFRYIQLLIDKRRMDDAILLAETTMALDPSNKQIAALVDQLQRQPK